MSYITRRHVLKGLLGVAGSVAFSGLGFASNKAERDTVRLTYAIGAGNITLLAYKRGGIDRFLKDRGIKVEWLGPLTTHNQAIQAVIGGSADFSSGGTTFGSMAAMLNGQPLKFGHFYNYLPRIGAIIATNPNIKTVQDLVGRKIACNRKGLGELILVSALDKYGIDLDKVERIYMNPQDAGPALAAGKIDAWSQWSPLVDIGRNLYKAHDVFTEAEWDFPLDFMTSLATEEFADRNPGLMNAVYEAYAAEGVWATQHPREVEEIVAPSVKYDDTIREYYISLNRTYDFYRPNDDEFLTMLQRSADWCHDKGLLPQPIQVRDYAAKI